MNLLNIHEICETCMQTDVQNMFKVKNKGTRIMSDIVLVSLDCQHQRHEYWEPSQTSIYDGAFFAIINRQKLDFQLVSKYILGLWTFIHIHIELKHIYTNVYISKINFEKKFNLTK